MGTRGFGQSRVPLPTQENGSKVVFTTRSFVVCGQMGANEKIEIRCLGENEAWTLFQHKVGEDTLDSHPDIRELAKMVVTECRGLPLALIIIDRAMIGKRSPKSWGFAIEVLKNSAHKFTDTARELYPILKFSYDNLPSDTMRSCFLYCCLFPEDHRILKERLIKYWFCEGLLDAFESINKARLQGHDIIDCLINASLLEDGENIVKMHDVIRDMALWISCEYEAAKKKFFVKAGLQLTEAPKVGEWEGVKRVSFMENQIECLTSTPTCPNLQTLFLMINELRVIENSFFGFMPNLRVLGLSRCRDMKELPRGISELVSLECLNLSGTNIEELPVEMKSLKKLKWLDMSNMRNIVRIPHHLMSSFSKLQVFRMSIVFFVTDMTREGKVLIGGEDDEGVIEELGSLQHLNEIHIEIKGAFALERLLRFHNLQGCIENLMLWNFSKSQVFNVLRLANIKSLKQMSICNCESLEEMKIERAEMEGKMSQSSELFPSNRSNNTFCFHSLIFVHLSNCNKLRDVTWLILAPNLRTLVVGYCAKIEEILREEKLGEAAYLVGNLIPHPFPKLERLSLFNLPQLKSIYPKALPFLSLRDINIENCSKLKKLPLNSDSAKENNLRIRGEEEWWGELQWEDEATRNAFLPSFKRAATIIGKYVGDEISFAQLTGWRK